MIFGINNDWFSPKRNLERLEYCHDYVKQHGFKRLVDHLQQQVFPLKRISPLKMFLNGVYSLTLDRPTLKRRKFLHLLSTSNAVNVILSFTATGGAEDYLDNVLRNDNGKALSLVLRDSGPGGIKDYLQVEAWRNGKSMLRFIVHKLSFISSFPEHRQYTIIINELFCWHTYVGENAMTADGIGMIVNEILEMKKALNATMRFMLHDFYCICPRIVLCKDAHYCNNEYDGLACNQCLSSGPAKFGNFKLGTKIKPWRENFSKLLCHCDEIRAFSNDSLQRVKRCYPFSTAYTLIPHENAVKLSRANINRDRPLTIGVFGSISSEKGRSEVLSLSKYLLENGNPTHIIIVGSIVDCPNPPPNITITGPYKRHDLPHVVETHSINVAFFSSVCPETFSFVTQELMMLGLPVVCFNIGAQAERVSKYEYGHIAKSMSAEDVWAAIQEAHAHFMKATA